MPRKILRRPEVLDRMGWSDSTLKRRIREKKFAAPVQLGSNSVGWYEDEVDEAQAALPRVGDQRESKDDPSPVIASAKNPPTDAPARDPSHRRAEARSGP